MPVTFYSSDDPGAPQFVVSGSSGSYSIGIIEIMDAVLVNGYNGKQGLGWTKLMTSKVVGSKRTLYSNQSAYESNCLLLVDDSRNFSGYFKMQITDTAISTEDYSGYSHAIQLEARNHKWMAVGDERTLIFFVFDKRMETVDSYQFSYYMPSCIYIGDVDRLNNTTHLGHALITDEMHSGTMETISKWASLSTFFDSFTGSTQYKKIRPVTQVPGEEWSENSCYHFLTSILPDEQNDPSAYEKNIASFEQNAQLRVPWFLVINRTNVYRLRGMYNIYPMLLHNDENRKAHMLKPLNIDGIEYRGTKQNNSRYDGYPMSYYIQTSGDW